MFKLIIAVVGLLTGLVICGTLMISEPNSYSAKILSIGQADQYGDQHGLVYVEELNIERSTNLGNTGRYKVGDTVTYKDYESFGEDTFIYFLTGLMLIIACIPKLFTELVDNYDY